MNIDGRDYFVLGDYAILEAHIMLLQSAPVEDEDGDDDAHCLVLERVYSGTENGIPVYGMQPTKFAMRRSVKPAFEFWRALIEKHLYKPSRSDLEMADELHQTRWPKDEDTPVNAIKLHQTTFAGLVEEMADNGIIVTVEQVKQIVDADPDFFGVLAAYYNTGGKYTGMDTQDREMLHEGFAKVILGVQRWPMYGDVGTVYETEFKAAIREKVADGTLGLTDWARKKNIFS